MANQPALVSGHKVPVKEMSLSLYWVLILPWGFHKKGHVPYHLPQGAPDSKAGHESQASVTFFVDKRGLSFSSTAVVSCLEGNGIPDHGWGKLV